MTSIPEKIKAMGYTEAKAPAVQIEYAPKPLSKQDADVVVLYNGVCHTDIHMIDNDWKMSQYPLVPGHEVIGRVIATGDDVKDLKVGDVVGLGALCQACGNCDWCAKERDNLCGERAFTYFNTTKDETGEHRHHGGFSSFLRTDSRQLFRIPDGYSLAHAGPLMCAGLTVAAPLYEWAGNKFEAKGKKVGIIGIGGLGHLAVQFSAKMGAETVAVSRGTGKTEFAKQLGASALLDSTNAEAMQAAAGTFDYLLVSIAGGKFDVSQYIGLLRAYGTLHFVGVPDEPISFPVQALMFNRLTVSSSPIGSGSQMKAMLQFAAENDIKPLIEEFPHTKANEAVQKVRDGTVRFRAVLKNDLNE